MLTRRSVLLGSAAVATAYGALRIGGARARTAFATKLPIPTLVDARAQGHAIDLVARASAHEFRPGSPVQAYGFSGSYLGPTLRLRRGEETRFSIRNGLQELTTVHWHGAILPGAVDGGPHNSIRPGEAWSLSFKLDQPPATIWYHAHPHGATALQVYRGLAGLILLTDDGDADRGLPHEYGVDDLPLVLQDRAFHRDGSLAYDLGPMAAMMGMFGDTVIVNGAVAPFARIPKGLVRLRLLNGSNARTLRLGFDDGRAFHAIASDAGYLAAPVNLKDIVLAPGERYEILVDFSDGDSVALQSLPHSVGARSGMPMMRMMQAGPDRAEPVMRFEPDATLPVAEQKIPTKLDGPSAPDASKSARRREAVLEPMLGGMGMMGMMRGGARMGINGRSFDMNRVDFDAKLGTTEIWTVRSQMMAHPFHIHGTSFRILSIDGGPPPAHLAGLKDVVLVEDTVELLVPFSAPADKNHPFMTHCHILEHEDAGMMAQFTVT